MEIKEFRKNVRRIENKLKKADGIWLVDKMEYNGLKKEIDDMLKALSDLTGKDFVILYNKVYEDTEDGFVKAI